MDTLLFHPKVVHIPIALAVLIPLLASGVVLAWWRQWLPARTFVLVAALQAVLLGSGIIALRSGEAEEERVERIVPEPAIEAHEEAAERFVWASGGVLAIMLTALFLQRGTAGLPTAAAAALGTLVVLGLGVQTGEAGGELVYQYGAASSYVDAQGTNDDARAEASAPYEEEEERREAEDDDFD